MVDTFETLKNPNNSELKISELLATKPILEQIFNLVKTTDFYETEDNFNLIKALSIDNKTEDKTELQSHPTTQLKILRLTHYKGSNLKEIVTNTPNLELLFINDYYSLDTFPEVDLPKLENLFLVSTSFEGLQNLKASKLDRLYIFMCYKFTPKAYAAIQQFTSLKKLSFSGSDNITTIPKEITTLLLTEFLMEHDVEEFPDYIKNMTTLETLSLGANAFENLLLWIQICLI